MTIFANSRYPFLLPSKIKGKLWSSSIACFLNLMTVKHYWLVRAAYRQAKSDDEPPAFRIVRWRADK